MKTLYIVSTPIGNLQDITLRAAKILTETPIIITESTSKFGILLDFFENELGLNRTPNQKVVSFSEEEENEKLVQVLQILEEKDAALASEAGTPLISDPGYKLVREAIKRGVNVVSIPGVTAPIAALTTSGLPTDKFFFGGYLPKKDGKKKTLLKDLFEFKNKTNTTLIFFESPHRLLESLQAIEEVFGDIDIVISRELTKIHEDVRREKISDSINYFTQNLPKGEFVVLI